MTARNERGLSAQQEEFAKQIGLYGCKGSGAYRIAYNAADMSPKVITVEVARLLQNPSITLAIDHYRALAAKHLDLDAKRVAQEMTRVGMVDPRDILDEDGCVLPPEQWPENLARAVAGIEVFEKYTPTGQYIGRVKKVKFNSKNDALRMLGTWKGLLIERVELGRPGEFAHLTDDQLEKELAAEEQALAVIERARKGTIKATAKPKARI